MATIQIRDVPEDVHRTYRRRAAESGMSLQEYLRLELVEGARARTPAEVVAEVERELARSGGQGLGTASSAEFVRADRDAR
ncbi:antitoxin [Geodermatophilus sp. TF02-6]|uniref:FitA-like ribbon-helix-helix domain-containing protein n=1 Tax=Geodermatophilus sp. TF02-6 TaxID=2250575 RepID=UPI000DEAE128|nr:antitoxin [Geodermatophilus sp. TF02-6]RBY74535.1 antitoxin [Geodermatophilus sp. TF02-6]